jgi:energy-coupling factor transport system permease protein
VVWATSKFLNPFARLGLPVAEAGGLLTLVLYFLPHIYRLGAPLVQQLQSPRTRGLVGRFQLLAKLLGDAVLALVEQADQLACALARGDNTLLGETEDFAWQRRDSICLALAILFLSVCWSL